MNLGDRIKELRLQKNMTQKDVVGEYMTRNMLSKIENGSATPSMKTLEFLSGALGVPMGYFLREEHETEAQTVSGSAHLEELIALSNLLLSGEIPETLSRTAALCIKARVLLLSGDAQGALSLFSNFSTEGCDKMSVDLIYKTIAECHEALGDYKTAYAYASMRLAL